MQTLIEILAEIQAPANEIDHWAQTNDFDFWIEVGVLTGPFATYVAGVAA